MQLPAYIEERIRRAPRAGYCIVPKSTPVIAFGNARTASVATLGLNPSRTEFLDRASNLLIGTQRRLATLSSLKVDNLQNASPEIIEKVLDDCNYYFKKNPFRLWFDRLNPVVQACNASYYNGTACHLDLIQWATDPVWGQLNETIRNKMVEEDAAFLCKQLNEENIRILLVNGRGAWENLQRHLRENLMFDMVEPIVGTTPAPCTLYAGTIDRKGSPKVRVIAWSVNRQSSWGVRSGFDLELSRRIRNLIDVDHPIGQS